VTVEVGPWPKRKTHGRRRREPDFLLAAKWCLEPYRASQHRPQRMGSSIFEPAPTIGTSDANDKNIYLQTLPYPNRANCATHFVARLTRRAGIQDT
jgi:hypothetical protein